MALSNKMETGSDFAICLSTLTAALGIRHRTASCRPSNDRVPGNKTER